MMPLSDGKLWLMAQSNFVLRAYLRSVLAGHWGGNLKLNILHSHGMQVGM